MACLSNTQYQIREETLLSERKRPSREDDSSIREMIRLPETTDTIVTGGKN